MYTCAVTVRCSEDLQPCVGSGSGSESSGLDPQSSGIDPFACATDTITTVTANTVSRGIEGGQNSPSISMSSSVGTMSTSGAVTSLPVVASTETRSVATSVGTPPSVTALRSTETTVLPTPSPMPQPQPSITTSPSVATSMQTMSVTSTTDHTAPDQISTTESPSLSILDSKEYCFIRRHNLMIIP